MNALFLAPVQQANGFVSFYNSRQIHTVFLLWEASQVDTGSVSIYLNPAGLDA